MVTCLICLQLAPAVRILPGSPRQREKFLLIPTSYWRTWTFSGWRTTCKCDGPKTPDFDPGGSDREQHLYRLGAADAASFLPLVPGARCLPEYATMRAGDRTDVFVRPPSSDTAGAPNRRAASVCVSAVPSCGLSKSRARRFRVQAGDHCSLGAGEKAQVAAGSSPGLPGSTAREDPKELNR
jgi:hypothetical protein